MRFIKNIIRLIEWIPVIWQDVDWDYEGLLNIIDYKVRRMRQLHLNCSHAAHWSFKVREMDELRHLIALNHEDPDDEWEIHFNQYCRYEKDINAPCAGESEHHKALKDSHIRAERNWHHIWNYLDTNLRNWWD